jgi:hypothetical protein
MFDIFILNKIQLFYYFILLNIIPLLYLYIIYTLKKQLEIYTLYLENHFYIAMISTSEDEDKEAVALFMCPVNNLKMHSEEEHDGMGGGTFKDVRFFILMQANNLIFDYKMYEYTCVETDYARKEYVKKYQPMVPVFYRYHYIPNFDEISVLLRKEFEYIIPKVVYLKAFLEVNDDITKPNFIGGRSNMLLLCGYICCWLYILLVSFHTLNILDVLEFLTSFQDYENPFTSIFEKH